MSSLRRACLSMPLKRLTTAPIHSCSVARAQRALPVVGYLSSRSRERDAPFLAAFLQGLKEHGFVEGQNVAIEYRWADGDNERLSALAADLAQRRVNVIAATGGTALAAK